MDLISRKSKKKGGKKKKDEQAAKIDPNDKFNNFKAIVRMGDNEFIQEKKSKDPYEYINKKT